MRNITTHFDGHGLNDIITITADEQDPNGGGASHEYIMSFSPDEGGRVAQIQFQHGPRLVEGSTPGVTEAALYAVLIDRMEGFQAGPYACEENEQQLVHLRELMRLTKARADERAARGVLGKNAK